MLCRASFKTRALVKFGSQGKWLNKIKIDQIQDPRLHIQERQRSILSMYAGRRHDTTRTRFQTHAE